METSENKTKDEAADAVRLPCWHGSVVISIIKLRRVDGTWLELGSAPLCVRRFSANALPQCADCRKECESKNIKLNSAAHGLIKNPAAFIRSQLDAGCREYIYEGTPPNYHDQPE
jgi:hypothetical protein